MTTLFLSFVFNLVSCFIYRYRWIDIDIHTRTYMCVHTYIHMYMHGTYIKQQTYKNHTNYNLLLIY